MVPAGQNVICYFNDQRLGKIVVNKVAVGGDGQFNFATTSLSSEDYQMPSAFSITTTSGSGSWTYNTADADQVYSITENTPNGWVLTGAICSL